MALRDYIENKYLLLTSLLCLGAMLLTAGAIYLIKTFSILYGTGGGSLVQSLSDNSPIISIFQQYALGLPALHTAILESYVLFVIAALLFIAGFVMFLRRHDRNSAATARKYTVPCVAFVFVYMLLFYVEVTPYSSSFNSLYIYVPYAGMIVAIGAGAGLEYFNRMQSDSQQGAKRKNAISMDPTKPFSNVVSLQEELFAKMSGHLRIIDKHFNSSALENLHRIMEKSVTNFTKVTILTSREMLDSSFGANVSDLRNEMAELGVGLEVRLMDEKDAVEQHERMLMDDTSAYKIPPLNIINKRSEHIIKINTQESHRRFIYLYGRGIKPENYFIKKAHGEQQ